MRDFVQDLKSTGLKTSAFTLSMPLFVCTVILAKWLLDTIWTTIAPVELQLSQEGGAFQVIVFNFMTHAIASAQMAIICTPLYGAVYQYFLLGGVKDRPIWSFFEQYHRLFFCLFAYSLVGDVAAIYHPGRGHGNAPWTALFFLLVAEAAAIYFSCRLFFMALAHSLNANENCVLRSLALSRGRLGRIFAIKATVMGGFGVAGMAFFLLHVKSEILADFSWVMLHMVTAVSVVVLYERFSGNSALGS